MFKVLPAIKDAYIQNRFVNGVTQVSGNVGLAGSLDLFKLYGYTSTQTASGTIPNVELSRLLVHFNLQPLRDMVSAGQVDINNASFNVRLHLFDVYGGQPTPDNFSVIVYPLSASFDEGHGRDVVYYSDYDACNWLNSSLVSGSWQGQGCVSGGFYPQACDFFTGSNNLNLGVQQTFFKGTEDLDVDITTIVSATLAGLLPDAGLRIAFAPALENDTHSYFVKRFGSRQAFNPEKRPCLFVRFDDSVQDDTQNFYLDSPSYLFLYNYVRNSRLGNLISGSTSVTGSNSLVLKLYGQFPSVTPVVVSSSQALIQSGKFTFSNPSDVLFAGTYSILNSTSGTITTGSQLYAGVLSGSYTTQQIVGSGSFVYADTTGIHVAISGTATFNGTLDGTAGVYALTGTYLPNGGFLFSASYFLSQTMGPGPYVAGPFVGSQLSLGSNFQTGIYSASVTLSSTDPSLQPQWQHSGSVTFIPVWGSLDGTVAFLTGSEIKAYPPVRGPQSQNWKHLNVRIIGLNDEYDNQTQQVLRVNLWDFTQPVLLSAVRLPVELPGIIIRDVHYQIRDNSDGYIAVPFDLVTNSTRLSNDSQNMFFTLDTSNLISGHSYVIDIMVVTDNVKQLYKGASSPFRVAG